MAVVRGFVQKIDVGRAGLVQVTLVLEDASTGVYVISDLDADPERFNERLSKLGVLRDAMNRAEPVEIEYGEGKAGNEINRAVRITRDDLPPVDDWDVVRGIVANVLVVTAQGVAAGSNERPDTARVMLLMDGGGLDSYLLDLQTPERAVAESQLRMLLDAEAKTGAVTLYVGNTPKEKEAGARPRIIGVGTSDSETLAGNEGAEEASGFVETLSLIRVAAGAMAATFANVKFTTAPDFAGPGNTVSKAPFTPVTIDLLVPKNSLVYALFEAGLRDNLRMRVKTRAVRAAAKENLPENGVRDGEIKARVMATRQPADVSRDINVSEAPDLFFALTAELLAPLASASRPVWIQIERESLDHGPECECTEGVPSSDLSPKTLRDLKIPYTAVWEGLGCFNPGVYRIQVESDVPVKVKIDGEKVCVYPSDNPKVKFAYACLCHDHQIEVVLDGWICDKVFDLDVYRLR